MQGQTISVKNKKKKTNSKQSSECMHTAPFVHGPMHTSGSVRACFFLTDKVGPEKEKTRSVEKLNSILGGPCKGLCTLGACARARLRMVQIFLSTGEVCSDIGKTRSVENF